MSLHRRAAVTHLLPAIIITAVAALAMLVSLPPAISEIRYRSNLQGCATNQRQLATALFAYRDQFDAGWPWVDLKGIDPNETSKYNFHQTVRGFERLKETLPELTPDSIFYCPGADLGPGSNPAKTGEALKTRLSAKEWGWDREDDSVRIPFAFDWSAPVESRLKRIILGDRSPTNHQSREVVVVYADGSFSTLPIFELGQVIGAKEGRNITITQGYNGEPLTGIETEITKVNEDEYGKPKAQKVTVPGDAAVVYNPQIPLLILEDDQEQAPDNIYDLNQDILDVKNELPQKVNFGSTSRTWLR